MNSVQNAAKDASYTTQLRRLRALNAFRTSIRARPMQVPNQEAPKTGLSASDVLDTRLGACVCTCGEKQC